MLAKSWTGVFDRTNMVLSADWCKRMCGSDAKKGLATRCLRLVTKTVLKEQGDVWYAPRRCFSLIHDSEIIVVCLVSSTAIPPL